MYALTGTNTTDFVLLNSDSTINYAGNLLPAPVNNYTSIINKVNQLLAVTDQGNVSVSNDNGKTWQQSNTGIVNTQSICTNGVIYLAVGVSNGTNKLSVSADGISWTVHNNALPVSMYGNTVFLYWDGNQFVLITPDNGGVVTNKVLVSSDGVNWTNPFDLTGFGPVKSICTNGNITVIGDEFGSILYNRALQLSGWQSVVAVPFADYSSYVSSIAWNGYLFCGVVPFNIAAIDTAVVVSPDGKNWRIINGAPSGTVINSDSTGFISTDGFQSACSYSTNGVVWRNVILGAYGALGGSVGFVNRASPVISATSGGAGTGGGSLVGSISPVFMDGGMSLANPDGLHDYFGLPNIAMGF